MGISKKTVEYVKLLIWLLKQNVNIGKSHWKHEEKKNNLLWSSANGIDHHVTSHAFEPKYFVLRKT